MNTDDGDLLSVQVERATEHASVVSLAGELDLSTIPKVEKRLLDEVRAAPGVIVDLTDLSFIDSSGIGLLIKASRQNGHGHPVHTVVAAGSQVERVFGVAGIDRALPIFGSRNAAIKALDDGRVR